MHGRPGNGTNDDANCWCGFFFAHTNSCQQNNISGSVTLSLSFHPSSKFPVCCSRVSLISLNSPVNDLAVTVLVGARIYFFQRVYHGETSVAILTKLSFPDSFHTIALHPKSSESAREKRGWSVETGEYWSFTTGD